MPAAPFPPTVFLDVDPMDAPLVRERFPAAAVHPHLPEDETAAACRDATIVSGFITTPFKKSLLEKLPKLKLLLTRSVGYDHIDLDACKERGILVCNVPDYGSHVIAEHVFALLLSTLRHITEGAKRVAGGVFDYHGLRGIALRNKTIGIVGTGKIGRRVAQIAHGFGMKILASDHCRTLELADLLGVQYVPVEGLFAASDIITLHMPATEETEHFIDAKAFARMKDGVTLVNTARGSLIDSNALLQALESGKVGNALLDVLEHEQNFEENRTLLTHPRVVATPHVGFYADDSMRNMYLDSFQSIDQWAQGNAPEHVVHDWRIVCDLPKISRK
ncbi:MAG: NAD(P)-dependent oxidoreductase [Candidatus Peribacteraceae bacterium]|nr:NAD(P)-dependent oxidoreductase [Candidatus Peribacteraceae bacterium]